MINVIVASHGPLASALLDSATLVYGELPYIFPVSLNETAGIAGFRDDFATTLVKAQHNADGVLVLCDMQSGTPWNVACQHAFSAAMTPPMSVLAGVNLPMLLQTDDIHLLTDVHAAAAQLLAITQPTLVIAVPVALTQSDDF